MIRSFSPASVSGNLQLVPNLGKPSHASRAWRVAAPVRWNYSRLPHTARVKTIAVTPTMIARHKYHLRDWKRDGADARRAGPPSSPVQNSGP